jgi:hypothetical protein
LASPCIALVRATGCDSCVLCRAVSRRIGGRPVNTTWAEPKKTEDTSQVGAGHVHPVSIYCMPLSCP